MFFPWTSPNERNAVLGAVFGAAYVDLALEVRDIVCVVGPQLDAVRDDERAVVERAAIPPQLDLKAVDDPPVLRPHIAAVDGDLVLAVVGVALADHRGIFVARDGDAHRAFGRLRGHRGRAGDEARLLRLAAEAAAHRSDLDLHLVIAHAERHRGGLVHLHRALRRWMDAEPAFIHGGWRRSPASPCRSGPGRRWPGCSRRRDTARCPRCHRGERSRLRTSQKNQRSKGGPKRSAANSKRPRLIAPTPPLSSASATEAILKSSPANNARMAKTQPTDMRRIRRGDHSRKSIRWHFPSVRMS